MSPFVSKDSFRARNFVTAHKQIIEYCANLETKYSSILIYENELKIDINKDINLDQEAEVIDFIKTNHEWDVIIIGKNNINTLIPIQDRKYIFRNTNSTAFITGSVYIVSDRFVEKLKNNNRGYIQTFVVKPEILENVVYPNPTDVYIVGKVSDFQIKDNKSIAYKWVPLKI